MISNTPVFYNFMKVNKYFYIFLQWITLNTFVILQDHSISVSREISAVINRNDWPCAIFLWQLKVYLSMMVNASSVPSIHRALTAAYVGARCACWPGPPVNTRQTHHEYGRVYLTLILVYYNVLLTKLD